MKNKNIIILGVIGLCFNAQAQNNNIHEGSYKFNNASQIWIQTQNAAGLSVDSFATRGKAIASFQHEGGDLKRVQEGNNINAQSLSAERFQPIGKYLYAHGTFNLNLQREHNRSWSDVFRSYNSNPYFSGSSINGHYDKQLISFHGALSSIQLGSFRYGIGFDYEVGDLSRLKDPRSRANLLTYKLNPSIVFSSGKHHLGVNAYYNRRKEKIADIRTVQTDPNMMYYVFSGMENAQGTIQGYNAFNREWVNHSFGAAFQHEISFSNTRHLQEIGIEKGTEYTYGRYKYEPGRFISYTYYILSQNRFKALNALHQLDFKAKYAESYANEYNQQLRQTIDPKYGSTTYWYENIFTFKKRYQVKILTLDVLYRQNFTSSNQEITGYWGVKSNIEHVKNKHLLYTSQLKHGKIDALAEAGVALLKSNNLWIETQMGYRFALKNSLLLADNSAPYAQNVLIPDTRYYESRGILASFSTLYQFPLNLKNTSSKAFIKAFYNHQSGKYNLNKDVIGVSVGIFH